MWETAGIPLARDTRAGVLKEVESGMRVALSVAAVLILTTGQVAAEGLPRPPSRIMAPGTPVGPSWSGFYVGAGLGAGALSQDLSGEEETLRRVMSQIGCQRIITNQVIHRSFS